MQTYKLYFKILKKSALGSILLFVGIFATLAILFSQTNSPPSESFELTKCKVAVIDHDNGALSKDLTTYLHKNTKPITIKEDEDAFKDALFFREVNYIAIIPKGFTDAFLQGSPLAIESMQIPDGVNATLVANMIDRYLNTAKLYLDGTGTIDYNAIHNDLALSTDVKIVSGEVDELNIKSSANFYMNYFSYPLLMIMLLSIPMIMLSINELNVKRRCLASSQKQTRFTMQLLFANIVMMLIVFLFFMMIACVMYPNAMFSKKGLLWCLNCFGYSLFSLCLGFFVSNLIKSKTTIWTIANILGLGLSFMGGAFVPQEMLSESLLKFGVVNPIYWLIKTNNAIDVLNVFTVETLSPILINIGIQIGFAIAFIAMTLVAVKQKRKSN